MKTKINILVVGFLVALYPPMLFGAPGESLTLDPVSGDYTITYADNLGNLQQSKFVPATKIVPIISSAIKLNGIEIVAYRYAIGNGKGAKQSIRSAGIYNISSLHYSQALPPYLSGKTLEDSLAVSRIWNSPITTPDNWRGYAAPDPNQASMFRANWSFSANKYPDKNNYNGIAPGNKQVGFGFISRDLPGIGKFKMWGDTPIGEGYVDEGPNPESDVGKQLFELEKNNFVLRNAAVPTIAVPAPFDAAITLERIQTHMHSWIAMQLLDPAFSAQLDRSFQSAISAYRLNQPKVGKQHIQAMRVLIKKEQPDADREDADESDELNKNQRALIDKLAARILDFDLKYVTKRMGGDD